MALTVTRQPSGERDPGRWVADQCYYLTREGRVLDEAAQLQHPDPCSLLVAKGCRLPMAVAIKHGLVKHLAGPPETKHMPGPPETKGKH